MTLENKVVDNNKTFSESDYQVGKQVKKLGFPIFQLLFDLNKCMKLRRFKCLHQMFN